MKKLILTAILLLVVPLFVYAGEAAKKKVQTVSDGKKVSIEYTLKLEDGTKVDSNVGGKPFTFIQGKHQIIPGLEKAIKGMKVGETRHIVVSPEEGYGPVRKEAFQEVDKSKIPPDALKVGAMLKGRGPSGGVIFARVAEVKEKTVVLDFNHPLAGKKLYFDVKILDVKDNKEKK